VNETFIALGRLQSLDSELATLAARNEEIPQRVERLKKDTEQARSSLDATRQAITDHKKEYKLAEVELKSAEEKIGSYSVQLYSAKTNEQYKAFLKEIETQKKIKSRVEDRMIVLMEEAERLEQRRVAAEKEAGVLDADAGRKVAALEAELAEVRAAVTEREAGRKELLAVLPPAVLKLYERVRKNKGGLAVVSTKHERCGGCLSPIPAQIMLEISRKDRIHTCEACGRILIPDGN